MNVEKLIKSTLKKAIRKYSHHNIPERDIMMHESIYKYMDSLDLVYITNYIEDTLKLDHELIEQDPFFYKAKTLQDLVDVYKVNYLGTDHNLI